MAAMKIRSTSVEGGKDGAVNDKGGVDFAKFHSLELGTFSDFRVTWLSATELDLQLLAFGRHGFDWSRLRYCAH